MKRSTARNTGKLKTKQERKAHKQLRALRNHDHKAISRFFGVAA